MVLSNADHEISSETFCVTVSRTRVTWHAPNVRHVCRESRALALESADINLQIGDDFQYPLTLDTHRDLLLNQVDTKYLALNLGVPVDTPLYVEAMDVHGLSVVFIGEEPLPSKKEVLDQLDIKEGLARLVRVTSQSLSGKTPDGEYIGFDVCSWKYLILAVEANLSLLPTMIAQRVRGHPIRCRG